MSLAFEQSSFLRVALQKLVFHLDCFSNKTSLISLMVMVGTLSTYKGLKRFGGAVMNEVMD